MNQLQARLLTLVGADPAGATCSQLCRRVNGTPQEVCYACRDYGNSWKRRRGIIRTPPCAIRKGRVWRALHQLAAAGLLTSARERVPDGKMVRGWDWMRVYRRP